MSRLGINTGSSPNDGQGDPLRVAMGKINSNFTEIYNTIGDGNTLTSYASTAGISTLARNLTGSPRINVSGVLNSGITTTEHLEVRNITSTGVVTATQFVGDGSQLTNVTALVGGLEVLDDNVRKGVARELNFGANIVSTGPDGVGRVTISVGSSIIISGIVTTANYASVAGYSTASGIATVAQGLTGTPNLNVGVVTATSYRGSGANLTGIITTLVAGTNVTITQSSGIATISASGGGGGGSGDYSIIAGYSTSSGISTVAQGLTGTPNISVGQVGIASYLSVSGVSSFYNDVHFEYDRAILIGNNDELQLFHNGANSYIDNSSGGNLIIQAHGGSIQLQKETPELMGVFNTDGSVELYYNNSEKAETTGYGVTIFGGLNVSGILTASQFQLTEGEIRVGFNSDFVISLDGPEGPSTYTFGNAGSLKLFSNLEIGPNPGPTGYVLFNNLGSHLKADQNYDFKIHAGGFENKVWAFSTDGSTILPNGTRITDIGSSGTTSGLALGNNGFQVSFGSTINDWAIFSGANLIQFESDNDVNLVGGDSVQITAGGVEGPTWQFNSSGNIVFPDATVQTTAYTGTATTASTVDILNTNGLTTIYYPTFVENRTDGQILRGDVDFTYVTDDNILTVPNISATSVVVGSAVTINSSGVNATGVVTSTSFSGSGVNLTGIVTSIVAGTNVTISGSTGQVTINASGGGGGSIVGIDTTGTSFFNQLNVSGVSTFSGITTNTSTLFANQLSVSGVSTHIGISTFQSTLFANQFSVSGVSTFAGITTVTGVSLFSRQLSVSGVTTLGVTTMTQLTVTGVSTFAGITTVTGVSLFSRQLSVSGVATATSFVGTGTSLTGLDASNIALGTLTNSRLPSDISVSGVVTATRFESITSGTPTIGAATTISLETIKVAISTDVTVGRNANVSGVVTATGGFISVGNTTPIQISLVGNQLTFTAVGIGSTTLTLF